MQLVKQYEFSGMFHRYIIMEDSAKVALHGCCRNRRSGYPVQSRDQDTMDANEPHSGSEGSHGARGSRVSIGVNAYAAYRTSGLGLRIVGQRSGTPGAVSLRRRRLGDMCGINQQSTYGPSGCTLLDWKKSKGAEGYVPPRSNGLIAGRSLMIAHNLESVSGSRLLWPAMVIK